MKFAGSIVAMALLVAGCATSGIAPASDGPQASRAQVGASSAKDETASVDARVDAIISHMSVESKVGQLIMPDILSITPDDVKTYRFGTILNGGNSGPGGNDLAPAPTWLKLADEMWEASVAPRTDGEPVIPVLWATDAVHGNSNIPGATVFPHNIGLGATHDPALVRQIGRATAEEVAVTGMDWAFAPTIAVVTDDRWGRTYESYGDDPKLVGELGAALIEGLQGSKSTPEFLDEHHVLATAKHFFGDGGTGGKDTGDTRGDLATLERIHAAPYRQAITAGVETVMASFSSVNGVRMHGNKQLLTGLLRNKMHFAGLVVGDWNGHATIPGCTNTDCPKALLAGLDVYMVPDDWKGLFHSLVKEVKDGTIPMARLDEAVRRVLEVKIAYHAFEKPKPSARALGGKWDVLGSPGHRALAREAVRKSLVLLKNDGVLPIKGSANVLVAGAAADSVPQQAGGWSISWQGGGSLTNADFPGATSIYQGIANAVSAEGGNAHLSVDGEFTTRPDLAVVVFGEKPYAEYVGDREDLAFRGQQGIDLLTKFKAEGIPTVAVFLSGRPMWVGREMGLADAFVAAWLPGSEGEGVADVLVGDRSGKPRFDFTGRLSFGWPAGCAPHSPLLLEEGQGGSYEAAPQLPPQEENCALLDRGFDKGLKLFDRGLGEGITAQISDGVGMATAANLTGASPGGAVTITAFDHKAQEDARRVAWSGQGAMAIEWGKTKLPAKGALVMTVNVTARPAGSVELTSIGAGHSIDLTSSFDLAAGKDWRTLQIPLSCFAESGTDGISLSAPPGFSFELTSLGVVPLASTSQCMGPF